MAEAEDFARGTLLILATDELALPVELLVALFATVEAFELAVRFNPKTGAPNGTTSHHSISCTVLPELELLDTYRLETPPSVRAPIAVWYRVVEDGSGAAELVGVVEVLVGGGERARPKTGYGICGVINSDSSKGGRYADEEVDDADRELEVADAEEVTFEADAEVMSD